jgi:membrane protease YdiL (CAAX protease family)
MGKLSPVERRHALSVTAAILVVFVVVFAYSKWLPVSPLAWIQDLFKWNFLFHVWFFLIPLSALAMKLGTLKGYGLTLPHSLRTVVMGTAPFLAFALFPFLGEALFAEVKIQPRLVGHIPQTLLFQYLFAACGEELFFRGFIQGSLNAAYGRPWRWGETPLGVGAIATAVLFGSAHLLNSFKPHLGVYALDWMAFAVTLGGGFVLGLARERAGTLVVPILGHALLNSYQTVFVVNLPGQVGLSAAIGVCFPLVAMWAAGPPVLRGEQAAQESSSGTACEEGE